MRSLGGELFEYGSDFQECREYARSVANAEGLHMVPSYHPDLVAGVASYWLELFRAQPDLDLVLVPIGQGSGICAAIAARQALGLKTRIIGVVSSPCAGLPAVPARRQKHFRPGQHRHCRRPGLPPAG